MIKNQISQVVELPPKKQTKQEKIESLRKIQCIGPMLGDCQHCEIGDQCWLGEAKKKMYVWPDALSSLLYSQLHHIIIDFYWPRLSPQCQGLYAFLNRHIWTKVMRGKTSLKLEQISDGTGLTEIEVVENLRRLEGWGLIKWEKEEILIEEDKNKLFIELVSYRRIKEIADEYNQLAV